MSKIRLALMISLGIFGIVFFAPNGGHQPSWAFFHIARATSWHRFFDWEPAWCSLKILMLCVALFLGLDSFGTLLIRYRRNSLAQLFFWSILLPCLGCFIGVYYFLKALL